MNKKTIVQLVLILIIIFSSFYFYNEYRKYNKEIYTEKSTKETEEKIVESDNEFNLLKNIQCLTRSTV